MATWEISENKLYLRDIESYIGDKKITIHDISDEFKKKSEKIFAYWYSGPIFIGDNDPMFIFGCTTRIDILNGIVEKITKVDEKIIIISRDLAPEIITLRQLYTYSLREKRTGNFF